jgi:type 1 glutamine amidotransferase
MMRILAMGLMVVSAVSTANAQNILFFNKSEGFEHSPVALKDGKTYAGKIMQELADAHGATVTETKNGSAINAENLKDFDLVMFYSSGDPTKASKDGGDAMGPNGQAELLEWIKNGGAFMAFHSTTDTFHTPAGGEVTPFIKMLGAEFVSHGKQFVGTVKVVDAAHPAMASIPQDWKTNEEWYLFKNFNKETMHVLALLDPGEERTKQETYNIPSYPVIWVSQYGNGKVYFSALGHGEEMWDNDTFQQSIVDAATWLLDDATGTVDVKPNYEEVVPKEK